MARLAAVEKALYYPTPLSVIPLIRKHITLEGKFDQLGGNVLDPCCGTGEAVEAFAEALGPRWNAFGVELEGERARAAIDLLGPGYALHAAIEQVTNKGGEADILFLNPPYDLVNGKRVENRFVKITSDYLTRSGILVLIVPEDLVGEGRYAKSLEQTMKANGYSSAKVFRFPEPEYEPFSQVVVFAKKTGHTYYAPELDVLGTLGDVPDYIHSDDFARRRRLNRSREGRAVDIMRFGYRAIAPMKLLKKFEEPPRPSSITDLREAYTIIGDPESDASEEMQPLTPMRDTHAVMVAASGMLNGLEIGNKLIRGESLKRTVRHEETNDNDVRVVINAEVPVTHLSLIDLETGEMTAVNSIDHQEEFEELMIENSDKLVQATHNLYPPLTDDHTLERWRSKIERVRAPRLLKGKDNGLFEPQKDRTAAVLEGWLQYKSITLVGEMSTGKTVMSLAASAIAAQRRRPGNRVIVIVLPPKADLVDKWAEEAARSLRMFENPDGSKGPTIYKVKTVSDVDKAFREEGLTIILLKETTAKLSSGTENLPLHSKAHYSMKKSYQRTPPAEFEQAVKSEWSDDENCWIAYFKKEGEVCPECRNSPHDEEGELPPGPRCAHCGVVLWQYTPHKRSKGKNQKSWKRLMGTVKLAKDARAKFDDPRQVEQYMRNHGAGDVEPRTNKYPLARYIRDRYHTRYILIVDEAHKAKGGDTAVGYAFMDLVSSAWRVLQMTGTIYGGDATSIFYLLYRTTSTFREMFAYDERMRFVRQYGYLEEVTKYYPQYSGRSFSGYKEYRQAAKERPGVAPAMASLLLPTAGFITLEDLGFAMPEYSEHTLFAEFPKKLKPIMSWLRSSRAKAIERWRDGDGKHTLAQWVQARIASWDIPTKRDNITDLWREAIETTDGHLFPKEEALLRLVWKNKQKGRKVIVAVAQINRRDPTPRLLKLLKKYGMRGRVMRASEKRRVQFLQRAVDEGTDVVFTSPDIVDVGVDLAMFQTAVWYGVHYSMYVVPQFNRRLYRLTQEGDVEVVYLAYNETPQAKAFNYIAEKMAAQQAIQGDIRNGLAHLAADEDFVARLQDTVLEVERLDSDWTMSDLPSLPKPGTNGKAKAKVKAKVIELPEIEKVDVELVELDMGDDVIQVGFGF